MCTPEEAWSLAVAAVKVAASAAAATEREREREESRRNQESRSCLLKQMRYLAPQRRYPAALADKSAPRDNSGRNRRKDELTFIKLV